MKFDEAYWLKVIKRPDWYLELNDFAHKVSKQYKEDQATLDKFNKQVRHFFEKELESGHVALGTEGYNFDQERDLVNTIVIHHTSHDPGYRQSYLNAVHLLNIYVPVYAKNGLAGGPIWSGHFKDGRQVFWGYHWLMRMDGKFERLLDDNEIGWHAGNWSVNKRSVGICLDNNYEKQDPADITLEKLAEFIKFNYPKTKIKGHCEFTDTICPGTNYMATWKLKLLNYL